VLAEYTLPEEKRRELAVWSEEEQRGLGLGSTVKSTVYSLQFRVVGWVRGEGPRWPHPCLTRALNPTRASTCRHTLKSSSRSFSFSPTCVICGNPFVLLGAHSAEVTPPPPAPAVMQCCTGEPHVVPVPVSRNNFQSAAQRLKYPRRCRFIRYIYSYVKRILWTLHHER